MQWMEICWPLAEGLIAVSDGIDACGDPDPGHV